MTTPGESATPAVDRRAASILDLTKDCLSRFDEALATQVQSSKEGLETRLADFNLWVSGVGAIAKSGLSLDSKLQGRPDGLAIVKTVLLMLSDSLEYYASLSQAGKNPHNGVQNIDAAIRNLAFIGVAIRRTGKASRSRRADRTFNPDNYPEFRKHLECLLLLRPTEEGRHPDELDPSKLSGLQRRLIDANLRRRHQFLLAQRRSRNQEVAQRQLPVLEVTSSIDDTLAKDARRDDSRNPEGSLDHPPTTKGENPHSAPTISGFSRASTVEGPLEYASAKPYIPGTTKTQITSIASDAEFPHPPVMPEDREIFQCPCCCQSLPVETFKDAKLWKRHVVEDLCPYTCIAENCPTPQLLFCTRSEWEAHVKKSHLPTWQCPFCDGNGAKQPNMEAMAAHLQTDHNDELSRKSLSTLLSWSAVQTMGIKTCPFCSDHGPEDTPDLVDHVLQEAYEFALRALPWTKPVDHELNDPPRGFTIPEKGGGKNPFRPWIEEPALRALLWTKPVDHELNDPPRGSTIPENGGGKNPFSRWIEEPVPQEQKAVDLELCSYDTADHSEPINLDEYTDCFDEGGYFDNKHEDKSSAANLKSGSSEAELGYFDEGGYNTDDTKSESSEAEPGNTANRKTLKPGLHIIYDSIPDSQHPDVDKIDVVAIPGFDLKDDPNHAQETWTKGDKLWLRDFLPGSLPNAARVMLFAYNSSPSFGASAVDLDAHARDLLQYLSLERVDVPQRPIVFICHSLGGLVVKQALADTRYTQSYKSIFEATGLLVFFATPHRTGKSGTVGDVAAKIFSTALGTGANELLDALSRNSNEATKDFKRVHRHFHERCAIISFIETRADHERGIMVDKYSATLGLPRAVEAPPVEDCDHTSICKFDSNDSPMCQRVCRDIAVTVKRILSRESNRREPLVQKKKTPAAGPATEHDPPEPAILTAPSFTSMSGIKVLYSPADAIVDIVFVHGLGGDREKTWTAHGAWVPWPEALLPGELPTARIITFGYNANMAGWQGGGLSNEIGNTALDLLTALATYRKNDDENGRPVIFVCHSYGGLVCKEALLRSSQPLERSDFRNIFRSTRGIAFLGTPHDGDRLWTDPFSRLILAIYKAPNNEIDALLKSNSEGLARMKENFDAMVKARNSPEGGFKLQPIQISCFYEELLQPDIGQVVVSQQSAMLPGYPATAIHSHHTDMAKFSSADDPGFKAVCGELHWWIKDIKIKPLENDGAGSSDKNKAANTEGPRIDATGLSEAFHLIRTRPVHRSNPDQPAERGGFEIAILCSLRLQFDAVLALLDHLWDDSRLPYGKAAEDPNVYTHGVIGRQNVVLAYRGERDRSSARVASAAAAAWCRESFPNIKLALIVGVCGAVPFARGGSGQKVEIVLGDVIISYGIVPYDFGWRRPEPVAAVPGIIRTLIASLQGFYRNESLKQTMAGYLDVARDKSKLAAVYPGAAQDRLFEAAYRHVKDGMSCEECACNGKMVSRARLEQGGGQPAIHVGLFASTDTAMKSGKDRDDFAEEARVMGFEQDGIGAWDTLPCVVIKGACDYADGHTNEVWERYAAATAAACMKAFLNVWSDT